MNERDYDYEDAHSIAVLDSIDHGIENVFVFVGSLKLNGVWTLKIFVSNVPNKLALDDCFEIDSETLKVSGQANKELFNEATISHLQQWVGRNKIALDAYDLDRGMGSDEFLDLLTN